MPAENFINQTLLDLVFFLANMMALISIKWDLTCSHHLFRLLNPHAFQLLPDPKVSLLLYHCVSTICLILIKKFSYSN